MTSSTIRSTSGSSARRKPVSPSWAMRTSWPSLRRLRRTPRAMARSSSMMMMRDIAERLRRREDDAERAALSDLAVQLDAAAVQLDDLLGDGEPQAGPLRPAGEQVVGAVEPLEDPFSVMWPHAGSVVLHLDGDVAPRAPGAHADALVLPSVLHRVVQQVEHHLRHGVAIHVHGRKLWIELRLVAGGQLLRLERLTDLSEQDRHLRPLQLQGSAASFQPRPVEQPLHHAREPI